MAEYRSLREFLDGHRADGVSTHMSMAGGKYFIDDDSIDAFYDLYYKAIRRNDKQFLTEVNTEVGPCRIDLDFAYDKSVKTHLHTRDQVRAFSRAFLDGVRQYVEVPAEVDMYVLEKDEPTYSKKGDKMKSGVHILVPGVNTRKCVEQRVRRTLLPTMGEYFGGLPVMDDWDKVYDEGIVNRSVPWTLYGSQKPDNVDPNALPYRLAYILRWTGADFQTIDGPQMPADPSVALIRALATRRKDSQETPLTEEGAKLRTSMRSSEGAKSAPRGRPLARTDNASSRGSSPNGRIMPPLDPEKRAYIRQHVMNLSVSRLDNREDRIKVGTCLHNIHPDLLDVFLDFTAQNAENYDETKYITNWNSFTFRNDGDRLSEGSLRYWSREDNLDNYLAIENDNVDSLMKAACSLTEYDSAALIYAMFRDNYRCSDFKFNVWYRWSGHIWQETDSGVDLLLRFSKEVAQKFNKRSLEILNYMANSNLTDCLTPVDKKDCGKCEYCAHNESQKAFAAVYKKLKQTQFKNNLMRECRELFFDPFFNAKLNANKETIAFNNGVLELNTMLFRNGKPEDYISFSTELDFDPARPHTEYPAWPAVEKFLHQILPNQKVREYFMDHLATNLFGGNPAQKFHILTGTGSNGKSMLMNLMTKALGDYACTVPISLFTQQRKSSGSAAPEVARLRGRRFVTMQEPDERIALNTGLMKEISSGEKMYARDLFKSGGEFEVLAKFHLACNEKPKINTMDGGSWRRLVVIAFLSKFVLNPRAPNEFLMDESIQFAVLSPDWATAFMAYLVFLLKTRNGIRKLSAPEDVMEYTSDYRNENDAIAKFVSEKVRVLDVENADEPVTKQSLRRVLKQWKDENDERMVLPAEVEKRIVDLFGKYPAKVGWTNFRLEN